jgi:type IV pilus assembly protein PilA
VKKLHTRRGGFTLIELMIVVAIIGILAAIAIPNFLRFQLKAKSSEGKTNLAAIRTAEESYFAEYGAYVSADPSPATIDNNSKTEFSHAVAGLGFVVVGWAPEGDVFFNYAVEIPANNDGFMASAAADIDNDSTGQMWGYMKESPSTGAVTPGKDHNNGLGTCTYGAGATNLNTSEEVAPCDSGSGKSVF